MASRFLVTGGSGFLGAAVARALLPHGAVSSLDRVRGAPEGVTEVLADLLDAQAVARALQDVDVVVHCAALVDLAPEADARLEAVNVQGTRNILEACRAQGVTRLVFTSSIDVVFDGTPIRDGDESLPIPRAHLDTYGATKARAEALVLEANGPGLSTCALRTAGVYGPGDLHRMPELLRAARAGHYVRMGDGRAVFNHVYVDNAAHAHVLAARALAPGAPHAGRAYFITDHAPSNFYTFAESLLQPLGLAQAPRRLPRGLMRPLASAMERMWRLFRLRGRPPLTPYIVDATTVDFSFVHHAATRDFGYTPVVDQAAAFEGTLAWLRQLG
jgi:nucleoside-diphosphate-sugar epimerase